MHSTRLVRQNATLGRTDQALRERIRIDPSVQARFPHFRLCVIYAFGVENGPSDATSEAVLAGACAPVQADFGSARLADLPHVAAWRAAYQAFGAKPSKYPCSVEAPLQLLGGGMAFARIGERHLVLDRASGREADLAVTRGEGHGSRDPRPDRAGDRVGRGARMHGPGPEAGLLVEPTEGSSSPRSSAARSSESSA